MASRCWHIQTLSHFPQRAPRSLSIGRSTPSQTDARLQRAIYAIALSRAKRHSDFPNDFCCKPSDVSLQEAQLLTEAAREHHIDEDEIEAEEYMISSAYEISCLTEGKKYKDLSADDFQTARHAESCQRCPFRTICWEKSHVH
jgi:hypothetical protein